MASDARAVASSESGHGLSVAPDAPRSPVAARGALVYRAPVMPLNVVRRFSPPVTRYGPGHLGVDLAAGGGKPIRAAADGVIDFAGPVAGRGVVVIAHRDGIRTEYEPVTSSLHKGQRVVEGQVIGILSGHHAGCAQLCLHWGARRGDSYLDPLSLLRPLGVVRLLPDGP